MFMFAADLQNFYNNPSNVHRYNNPCNVRRREVVARAIKCTKLARKIGRGTDIYGYSHYKESISLQEARAILRDVRKTVVSRDRNDLYRHGLTKWIRPWDAVPHLANLRVPVGDFGVGLEIERGFVGVEAASTIAEKVQNWHYLALDYEGGHTPIEATFAPILYSKFNSRSQPIRYTKLLQENAHLLVDHPEQGSAVGIHVNVSKGGVTSFNRIRLRELVTTMFENLTGEEKHKYFGRSSPYGWMYNQEAFIECKMFNSVADPAAVYRYVDVAVALVDLVTKEEEPLSLSNVRRVLEEAYNKRSR